MQSQIDTIADCIHHRASHSAICEAILPLLQRVAYDPAQFVFTWHPYGFLVIRLGTYAGQTQVRLHIWPLGQRDRQQPDWPIHNHSWLLESHILCGHICDRQYQITPDSDGLHRLYTTRFEHTRSYMEATTTRAHCSSAMVRVHATGDTYAIPHGIYHSTDVDADVFATTLVLMSQPTGEPPSVLGQLSGEMQYMFERRSPPLDTTQALVTAVIAQLA